MIEKPVQPVKLCSVENCGRRPTARGMCARHYDRARRNGDFDLGHPPCECGRAAVARGMCNRCYMRKFDKRGTCAARGCDNQARYANGVCRRHRDDKPRTSRKPAPLIDCPTGCGRQWHDLPADAFPLFGFTACDGSTIEATA